MIRKFGIIVVCLLILNALSAQEKIRVACVGNSVTYGAGIKNKAMNSYPSVLQKKLGDKYDVQNFGYSGATLLSNGHRPYTELDIYHEALEFDPHIVIIHLGLNDTDPRNWPNYGREFTSDYYRLIESFRELKQNPEIWICKMTPIFPGHKRFVWSTRDWFWSIQEEIEKVAEYAGVQLIDLHSPLYNRTDLFKDFLHPSSEGAAIIANTVYGSLTGDHGGLALAKVFSDNMLIQRDQPVNIWGKADDGSEISVEFAGKKINTTAQQDGKWTCTFESLEAGGPYSVVVKDETDTIELNNILIGDVWLCSGQSNMAFRLKSESHFDALGKSMDNNKIRFLQWTSDIWPSAGAFDSVQLARLNKGEYYLPAQWQISSESSAPEFSAVAWYFGKMISDSSGIPVGLIHNSIGGSTTESWISRTTLEHHPTLVHLFDEFRNNEMIMKWVRERARDNLGNTSNPLQQHPFKPAYLFSQGIEPMNKLAIKGVIWYQGESNAENVLLHTELFKTMVRDWRSFFGQDDLPIYYVQLSSIERPTWSEFRNSQRLLLEDIPNCGMAVSSDLGHPTNVHPKNKKDVGERLARWALAKQYGQDIECSGPLFNDYMIRKGKVQISFLHSINGLSTRNGDELRGFEIAGKDGIFYPAEAEILTDHVLVSSKQVKSPIYVRYAWAPYSEANLINSDGLPASTFITTEK